MFNVAIISANIPDQSKNQQEGYVWSPPSPFVCVSVSLKTKVRAEGDSQDKQKKKAAGDSAGFSLWWGINCAECDCFRSTSLW